MNPVVALPGLAAAARELHAALRFDTTSSARRSSATSATRTVNAVRLVIEHLRGDGVVARTSTSSEQKPGPMASTMP